MVSFVLEGGGGGVRMGLDGLQENSVFSTVVMTEKMSAVRRLGS